MQDLDKSNAEMGIQQKNTILQAWSDFKDSIFNVLFVILDKKSEEEEEESLWGLIFQSGLDYLQIMAFPFQTIVINAWNGGTTLTSLTRFFQTFQFSSYLPNAPFPAFLVMLYVLIFIILLIIADIIYVSYSFSKKKFKFTFPLVILAQIVPLFVTVLFLPISEIMLSVVECQTVDGVMIMTNFQDVVCWQGWHLFHALLALLFITLFVIISTVVALALFEPRMTTKKLTARQNSNGEVVFIINKIVLQFIFSFNPFSQPTFYVVTMFLLSFWQFWCYNINQPYYSKTSTKFFKICSTYYFWTSLMLLVGQLLSNYGFNGALIIWMCGLPFFGIIIYFEGASNVDSLSTSTMKFKSGDELDAHISFVLQLICNQKQDKNCYMLLIGYIQRHKEICNESDCPLKSEKKKKKSQDSMDYNCGQVLKQVERMFKSGIKKFPDCTKLRMSFSFFQLEHLHNKEKAYEQFTGATKLDPSFQQQFNIYRFKKIIRENLQDREETETDLVETIRFDNHVSLLEESMILSAKLHKQFWNELKEEKPDLKKLNAVGSQITEAGNAITQNYKEITKINSSACQVLYIYAEYLILVNEDYGVGKELLANARKVYQDRLTGTKSERQIKADTDSFDKLTSPFLIVEYHSYSSAPKITNANLMFTEITGYQREELFDVDLDLLTPNLFKQAAVPCFVFYENEEQQDGFIKHKFNYLIAVKYSMKQKAEGEWQILVKLDSHRNLKMKILVNEQGEIKDYNLIAQNYLKEMPHLKESDKGIINLADINIDNWKAQQYRKSTGSFINVKIGSKQGECMVHVQQFKGQILEEAEGQDEQQKMLVLKSKDIGWVVTLSKIEKLLHKEEESLQDESQYMYQKQIQFDEGVLQLYQNPNVLNFYISKMAMTKEQVHGQKRFELLQKIKTMRLMNNEIKMVYSNSNENDYNDGANGAAGEEDRQLFKFDDETYQAKLRTAINTNLNHKQVISLRKISAIFIIILFGLQILQLFLQNQQVNSIQTFINQIDLRSSQYSFLTSRIMYAINGTAHYPTAYNESQAHQVNFDSDVNVSLVLQNGLVTQKNLQDAVVFLDSVMMSYFQSPTNQSTIVSVFMNYINSIYPTFVNYPNKLNLNTSISFIMGGIILFITLLMMVFWIYISLKIDKKRYDIMIWFLDIPIPYVTHLGNHCDKYLKQFMTVKQLSQKGIPIDQDDDLYEEYSAKKANLSDQQQIQEQIKARKSLISKSKKQTLISKINLSALKVIWLLGYALLFSALLLGMSQSFYSDFKFLQNQWLQTSSTVVIDNTLYLALQMQNKNVSLPMSLDSLINTLKMDHKGVISNDNLQSFNKDIPNFHLTDISTIYNTVYFGSLCSVLNLSSNESSYCNSLVGNKLQSGYQVYSKYLITPQVSMTDQIAIASSNYVLPALITMLGQWELTISLQATQLINLCTIILYIFIIFSIIAYLLLWLYYLRKLNTQLNQTIQMLNMIPFKLLPKSRKETKMFIAWIIRQANKINHQDQ